MIITPFSIEYTKHIDAEMDKAFVAAGVIILLSGVVITSLSFVNIPITISEPYEALRSSAILNETFSLGNERVIHTVYFTKGELVNIQVVFNGGDVVEATFMVFGASAEYIHEYGARLISNRNWTAPLNGNYSFMYIKHGLYTPAITVTELVTRFWTETAYRDITASCHLLPFELLFLGIVLVFVGLCSLFYFKKRKYLKP